MKQNNTVPVLDSLRALAALSVCLFHFVCNPLDFIYTQWILDVFDVGRYGVQLFFVISGFIIPWSMYHAKFEIKHFFKFGLKRFIRLEPVYIASLLLSILVLWGRDFFLHTNNFETEVGANRVLLHFGYLIPFFENYKWFNLAYWTLAIEFQYYFFIALSFTLLIKSNFVQRIIVGVCMIALTLIGTYEFLPYWLPVFYIGIVTFLYQKKIISNKWEYYITLVSLFSFCVYKYPLASVVYTAIPVIAILFFSQKKVPVLHSLGKISYSVYLIHSVIGAAFINIMSHHFRSGFGKFSVVVGGVVITLISSYVMYWLVEKPSRKLSSSIQYEK